MFTCHLNELPCAIDNGIEPCQVLIQTVWQPYGDIEISILYPSTSNDGYVGCLPKKSLESAANSLEIQFDRIHSETTLALTTNGGFDNFLYHLNTDTSEFVLRKQTGSLKIIYGRVRLAAVLCLKDAFLKRAINLNISNNKSLTDVSLQFHNLKREHAEMTATYDDYVSRSCTMKSELLEKFIVLLNTKKDKIAELEKELEFMGERLRQVESTTGTRSKQQYFSDDAGTTTDDEVASGHENSNMHGSAKRIRGDSSQSQDSPACILPRRTKTDSPEKRCEIGRAAWSGDSVMNYRAETSKVVGADVTSMSTAVTDSQSIFLQDTEELINDM